MKYNWVILSSVVLILLVSLKCSEPVADVGATIHPPYLNHNDTVKYMGINVCKECHYDKYITFIKTGMGLSFDSATRSKSASVIGPDSVFYDHRQNLFYKPYWDEDLLKFKEFRLSGKETIHKRTHVVDFVVGSGQHTNSHIYVVNGYAHQVPFTFYTQDQRFDFPPGFEGGLNKRFSRKIGLECMSCHNAFPEMVMGSENKYTRIPTGIDCERCHGPGEVHVSLKKKGIIVDTTQYTDYSIVNPADLTPGQQFDICTRCHLQGTMVLKAGKSFYDFKPGMDLSRAMDIFMPRYQGGREDFIMASHVERLKESQCYISEGDRLNCMYCHVAHISSRKVDKRVFVQHCESCHGKGGTVCTAPLNMRMEQDNYCIACHMAVSKTRDIPHVRIHDHKIAIPPTPEQLASERRFRGLISVNNPGTDDLSMAKGYLLEYEAYYPDQDYLDSAYHYLRKAGWLNEPENLNAIVNYYYLKKDHLAIAGIVELRGAGELLNHILVNQEYSNYDAWTAYRIGQALEAENNMDQAGKFFEKAVELANYNLEFQNKLGSMQVAMKELDRARQTFEFILSENPLYASAHVNYGYTMLLLGDMEKAGEHYDIALDLDPDQVQALLNKAGLCFLKNEQQQGMYYIERVLTIEPNHPQANLVKERFNQAIR